MLISILRSSSFFCCAMTIYSPLILFKSNNQIEFDLKSINQEFLLFRKSQNKRSIYYLII